MTPPLSHSQGFAALSTEILKVGDVPAGAVAARVIILRNLRSEDSHSSAWGGVRGGSVLWTFDAAHPLISSGVLALSPRAGELAPGASAVILAVFHASADPAVIETDVACVVSATPAEAHARAEGALVRAARERLEKAARLAKLPLASRAVHESVATK